LASDVACGEGYEWEFCVFDVLVTGDGLWRSLGLSDKYSNECLVGTRA